VTGGESPLKLVEVAFDVASSIGQSVPLVSASNTITVSITGSVDIAAGSNITITGLTGTQTGDGTLTVTSVPADVFTSNEGTWAESTGTLTLTVDTGGLSAGTTCTVSFEVQNGGSEQNAVVGVVSGTIEVGGFDSPISDHNLEADTTAVLYGVTGGESPLKLVEVAFDVASSIGQSVPLVSASNTITVTITVDHLLPSGSTVEITGLTGTQTVNGTLTVTSSPADVFTSNEGAWTESTGTLTLTVASGGLIASQGYVLSFEVQNRDAEQLTATTVSVSGDIPSGGDHDSLVESLTLVAATGDLMGVTGGAGPLLLAVGTFVDKDIGQSFPFVDGSNTITVSITGSVDIAAGSNITITGLTGTQTGDGTLTVTSVPADVFTSNEGTWAESTGTLTLTVDTGGLSAGTTCTVSFEVQNGGSEQNAVVGVVSGTIEVGGFDSPISDHNLEADTTAVLYGVTGGESPLKLVEVAFDVASSIGQSVPLVSASQIPPPRSCR
jgi:hypothetical protein